MFHMKLSYLSFPSHGRHFRGFSQISGTSPGTLPVNIPVICKYNQGKGSRVQRHRSFLYIHQSERGSDAKTNFPKNNKQ